MYCKQCGANLPANSNFCTSCGTPVSPLGYSQTSYAGSRSSSPYIMYALAYIPILFWTPFVNTSTKTPFGKSCANQGLISLIFLAGISVIRSVISGFLTTFAISTWNYGFIGFSNIITFILNLVTLAILVFCIVGIVNAAKGKYFEIPIIGKIKIIK